MTRAILAVAAILILAVLWTIHGFTVEANEELKQEAYEMRLEVGRLQKEIVETRMSCKVWQEGATP